MASDLQSTSASRTRRHLRRRTSEEGGPVRSAKSLSLDSAYATCERTRNQSIRKIMGSTSSITIKKTKNGCGGPTWK
jgi:hypothetical protein